MQFSVHCTDDRLTVLIEYNQCMTLVRLCSARNISNSRMAYIAVKYIGGWRKQLGNNSNDKLKEEIHQ